jgi:MFS family permease
MVIPALPVLTHELDTSTTWATWIVTAFMLVSAVATPIVGKLGDQHGKELLLLITLGIFFVGCVAAIFAWDIWSLIAARAIQGVGGAVFPLAFAIVNDEFPREKVATGVGLVSAVMGIGGGLGFVLSGVIVDYASWRIMFVIAAAAVALAAVLVWRFVPESPVKTPSRIDVPGALLLSASLAGVLLALTEGERFGWASPPILALFGAFLVCGTAWVRFELRAREPMIDMRMLADRTVLLTNLTAIISGFAMFSLFVLMPHFVEAPRGLSEDVAGLVTYGFGSSPTAMGLYLLPGALAGLLVSPFAGALGRAFGPRVPLSLGIAFAGSGALLMAVWHESPSQVVVAMLLHGMGVPLSFAAMASLIVASVRPTETGVATGMNTVLRVVGAVLGGQIGAAILAAQTIGGTDVPSEGAFETAFWLSACLAFVAAAVGLFVNPRQRPVSLVPAFTTPTEHELAQRRGLP